MKVLDHGYVELVEAWGSEERIIEAARMSTGKGFLEWGPIHSVECLEYNNITDATYIRFKMTSAGCICKPKEGDEKLLHYLYEHKHTTPFEMAGLTIEVQAPIFVFREWHRHRTQSYNELSARYTPMPDVNYLPSYKRLFQISSTNKQAQGQADLNPVDANTWLEDIEDTYSKLETLYQYGLKIGIPKELARIIIPVGRYSRMRASANLLNWLRFLKLRMDENAQWEIRQYAFSIFNLIEDKFPRTAALFQKELNK